MGRLWMVYIRRPPARQARSMMCLVPGLETDFRLITAVGGRAEVVRAIPALKRTAVKALSK